MTSRYERLLGFEFPEFVHDYSERDTILYALGCGAGEDLCGDGDLRLVYEKDMVALPSMAVTLAYPGFWYRDLNPGLDFVRTVHASERFELDQPLPVSGKVIARPRIVAIHDKGEGRGSLIVSRREIVDAESGRRLGIVQQTAFCRGDGGLGGDIVPTPERHMVPARTPDEVVTQQTSLRAAAIYRLSGDYNPLHIEPQFAAEAGFDRPILHGLSTYGHVCKAIMRARGLDAFMRVMDGRFTAPVFPGDQLEISLWHDGPVTSFRVAVGERIVMDDGTSEFG